MSDRFEVALSNPRARVVETESGPWFVSALDLDGLTRLVRTADSLEDVRERVGGVAQNATLVHVATDGAHAGSVAAYRSPAASRELYHLTTPDGTTLLTDHFRTALAALSVDDRTPSGRTIADHLLFRSPIPPGSFVEEVGSVGHGSWVEWTDDGPPETTQPDRFHVEASTPPRQAAAAVDDAIAESVAPVAGDDAVNLLSGGVDSTLLHTYLDDGTSAVSGGIDSHEYAFEMEYAADAAELLGVPYDRIVIEEESLLDHVERGIEALGSPSFAFPTVLADAALRHGDPGTYTMAVGADAMFGMGDARAARIAAWLAPLLSLPAVDRLAAHAPEPAGSPMRTLLDQHDQLRRDPTDPESLPQQAVAYTSPSLAGTLVGDDLVAQRCRRLVEYVDDRVVDAGGDGVFAGPVEYMHLVSFYAHRIGSRYRQLAVARGKPLVTPFETERMMRCSLSIPVERRYVEGVSGLPGLEPKYLLKSLLERRLPGYDTDKEKGAGILPFERYREDGPLQDAFERYEPPEFVPDGSRGSVLEGSGRQAWNVLTFAIWRDRVLADPELEPVDGTRRFEFAV